MTSSLPIPIPAEMNSAHRKLLRGKKVLIVGVGSYIHIIQELVALGIDLYVVDVPDAPWGPLAKQGLISAFIPFDLFQETPDLASDIVQKVRAETADLQFEAVTTYYEEHVELALLVADLYGVAMNDVSVGKLARDKGLSRIAMEKAGLPLVKYANVRCEKDIPAACEIVPFPAVFKPLFGWHSIGAKRMEKASEVLPFYRKIKEGFQRKQGMSINDDEDLQMILEEYLDGDEFDVDILFSHGEVVYCNVVDNHCMMEPWFPESGGKVPTSLPREKQVQTKKMAIAAARSLGYRYGVVDVELRRTSRGPRILEINGRVPCATNPALHMNGYGIDLVEAHITAMLGMSVKHFKSSGPIANALSVEVNSPYSGTVCSDDWLEFIRDHENVVSVVYKKKTGDEVVGPKDGLPSLLARVVMRGDDMQGLLKLMNRVFNEEIVVPITPQDGKRVTGFNFDFCR